VITDRDFLLQICRVWNPINISCTSALFVSLKTHYTGF